MASGGWIWLWTVLSFLLGQAVILGGQLLSSRAQSRRETDAREAEVRKAKQDRRDTFELSHLPELHAALSDWISIAEPTLTAWCRWHRLGSQLPTERRPQSAIDDAIAALEPEAKNLEEQWNACVERVRRVLQPEKYAWRRGLEEALAYRAAHGDLRVPYDHRTPAPADGSSGDGFPLGTWIAEQRRARRAGRLANERIQELDAADMVRSQFDAAFEDGLTACRTWSATYGHLLPRIDAVTPDGFPVGRWLKNQRAAARTADRATANPSPSGPTDGPAGALTAQRREALEEIDPSWCPAWPVDWQRAFHLARRHLQDGGTLTGHPAGHLVIQGEDLGRWITDQQNSWSQLSVVQQWLLSSVLGIAPAAAADKPKPGLSHAGKWALTLAAARQYHQREGHVNVPRQHTETVGDQAVKLGVAIANARARRGALTLERVEALDALGMRWS